MRLGLGLTCLMALGLLGASTMAGTAPFSLGLRLLNITAVASAVATMFTLASVIRLTNLVVPAVDVISIIMASAKLPAKCQGRITMCGSKPATVPRS